MKNEEIIHYTGNRDSEHMQLRMKQYRELQKSNLEKRKQALLARLKAI